MGRTRPVRDVSYLILTHSLRTPRKKKQGALYVCRAKSLGTYPPPYRTHHNPHHNPPMRIQPQWAMMHLSLTPQFKGALMTQSPKTQRTPNKVYNASNPNKKDSEYKNLAKSNFRPSPSNPSKVRIQNKMRKRPIFRSAIAPADILDLTSISRSAVVVVAIRHIRAFIYRYQPPNALYSKSPLRPLEIS